MDERTTRTASVIGAFVAAFTASACCIGPLVLALLGLGGAGALVALEPYRPAFAAVTFGLLGTGWWLTLRRPAGQAPGADDCGCEQPRARRAGKRMLWVATILVGLTLAFPYLVPYLV